MDSPAKSYARSSTGSPIAARRPAADRCCVGYTAGVSPQSSAAREARFWAGIAEAQRFFMGKAEVYDALLKLTRLLDAEGIPYAIAGAMALNEHGYQRVTTDVDVLLTREGLAQFKSRWLGRGVTIDVLIAGEFPGDGKPKPIAFPDPATAGVQGERGRFLPLPTLLELKLASGMTAPHRLRDLADVLELIRVLDLPRDFAGQLHPYVRETFDELWQSAQSAAGEE
jgi:hypothetical protein